MKVVPGAKASLDRARRAPVKVEHTRLTVVEASEAADPGALEDAIQLLVTWAMRAQRSDRFCSADAATPTSLAACSPGDST